MKFNFNELFLKSINEILDIREKTLKEHIKVNYTHIDDLSRIESIESKVHDVENIIEHSEIEYRDFSEYVERFEISEIVEHELEERCLISSQDLEEAFENSNLDSRVSALENSLHETRIIDLENYGFQREERIKTLESENQELKERLLHIENFLLKTFKEFNND